MMGAFSLLDRLRFLTVDGRFAQRREDIFDYPEVLRTTYAGLYPDEVSFYAGLLRRHCGTDPVVVDLASGWGRVATPLAQQGFRVMKLDSSRAMLRATAGQTRVMARAEALPFSGARVDAFLMPLGILNSLAAMPVLVSHFAQVAGALRPGGIYAAVVCAAVEARELIPHHHAWNAHSDSWLTRTEFSLLPGGEPDPSLAMSMHRIIVRATASSKPAAWPGRAAILEWRCPARVYTPGLVAHILSEVPDLEMVGWHRMFELEGTIDSPRAADGASVLVLRKRGS